MSKEGLLSNRIRSVGHALKGGWLLIKTERSIKIQVVIALLVTAAGFYYDISNTEWMFQVMAIALVLGVEGVNTAIEKLSDFVHPDHDPRIGFLKDVSAGAVMFVSVAACIVGFIIYLPKVF